MKSKKFFKRNLKIFVFTVVLLAIFSNIYNKNFNNEIFYFNKYRLKQDNSYKLIVLGSSHTMYGVQNDEIMNLSMSRQNFYYDLELLKEFKDKIDKDSKIIIPISLFSFYNENCGEINLRYSLLLDYSKIKDIEYKKYILYKYFSMVFPISNLKKFVLNMYISVKTKRINKVEKIEYRKNINKNLLKQELPGTINLHLFKMNEYYDKDFINLVNFIRNNNWKIILITTPFSEAYLEGVEKVDKDIFNKRINNNIIEVQKKLNIKFEYLDYSHDSRFKDNIRLFMDNDHLNEQGAEKFTEILMKDINNYKK